MVRPQPIKTQVAIIGAGPAGLLLGQLLHRAGIDNVVLERQTKVHVLSRIRAGVLERGLVSLMSEAGAGDRLARKSFTHEGTMISMNNELVHIPLQKLSGHPVTVYGQMELTRDLYDARDEVGAQTIFEVTDVTLNDLKTQKPSVEFSANATRMRIECDYIAGCDGFHGVCRQHIPPNLRTEFEKIYPFATIISAVTTCSAQSPIRLMIGATLHFGVS